MEVRPNYSIQRKELERGKFEVTIRDFPKTTESYRLFQINVRYSRGVLFGAADCLCGRPLCAT